jgi:hypothetical protein
VSARAKSVNLFSKLFYGYNVSLENDPNLSS